MDSSNSVVNVVTPPPNLTETERVFTILSYREVWTLYGEPETKNYLVKAVIK